jgi:hypothetical protein
MACKLLRGARSKGNQWRVLAALSNMHVRAWRTGRFPDQMSAAGGTGHVNGKEGFGF